MNPSPFIRPSFGIENTATQRVLHVFPNQVLRDQWLREVPFAWGIGGRNVARVFNVVEDWSGLITHHGTCGHPLQSYLDSRSGLCESCRKYATPIFE